MGSRAIRTSFKLPSPVENRPRIFDVLVCSIVVPTFNEADNVLPLLQRIKTAFAPFGLSIEVIFVDDSPSRDTVDAVEAAYLLVGDEKLRVKSVYRTGTRHCWGGLGGAVIEGIKEAASDRIIVMDGDLQHPPELLPKLLMGLTSHQAVIASRYCQGGDPGGLSGAHRHFVSKSSTYLSRMLFPKALKHVTDPMTGYFGVRKSALNLDDLKPTGFKILLEILARHPHLSITEVPLKFGERHAGDSKASLGQGLTFIKHVSHLRLSALRIPRTVRFGAIGGGVFIFGNALLFGLVEVLKMAPITANGIQLAVTFLLNFMLNKRFTWGDRSLDRTAGLRFLISRSATTILNFFLFAWLVNLSGTLTIAGYSFNLDIHYLVANVLSLMVIMALNFIASDKWVFKDTAVKAPKNSSGLLPALKDVAILGSFAGVLYLIFGAANFFPALLVCLSVLLFAQASVEIWRMLYSYRDAEAVDSMRFPEPQRPQENFCLIVCARHEEEVLEATLLQLDKQTHPKLTILSVVCHDDPETLDVARLAASKSKRITVLEYRRPDGVKPSKPLQLNYAFEWMAGKGYSIVGVIDAEDTVHPELLRHIDTAFRDEETEIVQGGVQLMNFDHAWFSLHNVLEYWKWFSNVMKFQADHKFVPLGGNTVFLRYDLLKEAGGWPQSLTEDCALGVLLSTRFGAKVSTYYEPELATREETPATLRDLFFQRVRWMQGFYHEWRKGVWHELPTWQQRFIAFYVLSSPTFQAFCALLIPITFIAAISLKAHVGLVLIMYAPLVMLLIQMILNLVYLHDFGKAFGAKIRLRDYLNLVVTHFAYQFVLNAAALWALIREVRGDSTWHKTKHSGIHRSAQVATLSSEAA